MTKTPELTPKQFNPFWDLETSLSFGGGGGGSSGGGGGSSSNSGGGFWSSTFGGGANTGNEGNEGNEGDENNEGNEGNEGDEGNEGNFFRDIGSGISNIAGNIGGAIDRAAGFIGDHNGNEGNEGNEYTPPSNTNSKGVVTGKANVVVSEYKLPVGTTHLTVSFYDSNGRLVDEMK